MFTSFYFEEMEVLAASNNADHAQPRFLQAFPWKLAVANLTAAGGFGRVIGSLFLSRTTSGHDLSEHGLFAQARKDWNIRFKKGFLQK